MTAAKWASSAVFVQFFKIGESWSFFAGFLFPVEK